MNLQEQAAEIAKHLGEGWTVSTKVTLDQLQRIIKAVPELFEEVL